MVEQYALAKQHKYNMIHLLLTKNSYSLVVLCLLSLLLGCSSDKNTDTPFTLDQSIPINVNDYSVIEYNYEDRCSIGLFQDKLIVYSRNRFEVYNKSGQFITNFGKKGRGPKEYMILKHSVAKDDTLLMVDQGLMKIDWFNKDIKYIKTTNLKFKPTDDLHVVDHFFIFSNIRPRINKLLSRINIYDGDEVTFHNSLIPLGKQPNSVNFSFVDTYNLFIYTKFFIVDSLYQYSLDGNHIKTYALDYTPIKDLNNPSIDELTESNNYKITGTFMNFRFISNTQFLAINEGFLILFERHDNTFKAINGLQLIDNEGYFSAVSQVETDSEYIYLNSWAINTVMKVPLTIFSE